MNNDGLELWRDIAKILGVNDRPLRSMSVHFMIGEVPVLKTTELIMNKTDGTPELSSNEYQIKLQRAEPCHAPTKT